MKLVILTLFLSVFSLQSHASDDINFGDVWESDDSLGANTLCTKNFDNTCFKMPAKTKEISECHFKEDYDKFGNLVLPKSVDYDNLLRFGHNAKGWTCNTKNKWLLAVDVITYSSMWGGVCAGTTGNVPLATVFAVTGIHAWLVEKALSKVPCEAVNSSRHDDPLKGYICKTVKGQSNKITCEKNQLKIERKFEFDD